MSFSLLSEYRIMSLFLKVLSHLVHIATFHAIMFVMYIWSVARDKDRQSNPSSRGQVALLREILARNDHVCNCDCCIDAAVDFEMFEVRLTFQW